MNTIKTTEAMRFSALLNCAEACALYPDMADWFTKKLEQIETRKLNKKPTATQAKNVELLNAVLEFMREHEDTMFTVSDLIKQCPACAELSNQKCFSIVKLGMDGGTIKNIKDKRKSLFQAC